MYQFHDGTIEAMAKVAFDLDALMSLTYLNSTYANDAVNGILEADTTFYLSLHSASPSTSGANEILGSGESGYSSGGYTGTRMALTFGSASSGVQTSNDTQTFPLLATFASGIPYFGIWTDTGATSHAGTYICGGATSSGLSGSIPSGASVIFTNGVVISVQG